MRIPFVLFLAGSSLAACTGTRVVYVPAPGSAPAPVPVATRPLPPPPMPMPPVAVTIARVDDNRLLVSTNQPAYLAVFEIVPNRGVTLAYPTTPKRQLALAGSNWITVSRWSENDRYDRNSRRSDQGVPERHLYVIASDRPLRLTDDAFDDAYLRTVVGPHAYRADEPYETMAALSRRFVPAVRDEEWGEDLFTTMVARPTIVVRVARIYCPDGSVTYVREDMAVIATCPYRRRRDDGDDQPMAMPPRPDSVVASNGRPIAFHRPDPARPTPVFRVPQPADVQPVVEQQGNRRLPLPGNPTDGDGHRGAGNDTMRVVGNPNKPVTGQPADPHDNSKPVRRIGPWGIPIPATPEKPDHPTKAGPPEQKPENKPAGPTEQKPENKPATPAEQKPENKPAAPPVQKPDNKPAAQPDHKGDTNAKPDATDKHERAAAATDSASASPADSTDGKRRKGKPETQNQKQ